MYAARILADSIGPHEVRLTTVEATFPRFILAEVNTHRMLSRNSASSRAIPTEKQIERVMREPFIPEFNKRVTGMGVGEAFSGSENRRYKRRWLEARDAAVKAAEGFLQVDKSRANRLLEPFMWHTAIISATEWENFFGLRCHPAAQPEFRRIAEMMQEAMWLSEPRRLNFGDWHLPLVFEDDDFGINLRSEPLTAPQVSAGRCARVSYDRHHDEDAVPESLRRWQRLSDSGHWSPGEHPAQCVALGPPGSQFHGNFRGWKQLRKFYENEDNFAAYERTAASA